MDSVCKLFLRAPPGNATNSPSAYTLTAGDHDTSVTEGNEQRRQVVTIIRHPDHNSPVARENDIALMKVSPPFVFNQFVQPIKNAPRGYVPSARANVTGWGALTEGGSSPVKLYKVNVPVVSDEVCRTAYGQTAITDSMICSGEGGKDSCQGDSGGPMTCETETGEIVLCGIVSWGSGCARPGFPGVYTESSYYNEWIEASTVPPPEDNSTYVVQDEGCGGVLIGTSGKISYKLGERLAPNERCVWTIRVNRDGLRVRLLESGLGNDDFVFVTTINGDAEEPSTSQLRDEEVKAGGPILLVTLKGGSSGQLGQGFSLEFYGTGFAAGEANYNHFHYNNTALTVEYPASSNYGPSEQTTFVINPSTQVPSVQFTKFDVESDSTCQYDSLNVLNFDGENYVRRGKYCGTQLPPPFLATDGIVLLVLVSDDSVERRGFEVNWASA